jgi:CheY-like chemotaxis protein
MNKIMLIEDDCGVRMLYEEELTDEGYSVISSVGGEGSVEMLETQKPDLILLDVGLRGTDGLELLQRLKRSRPWIPVILCTAYEGFFRDRRSAAADGYVVKSSDLGPLKKEIGEVIRLQRLNREIVLLPNAEPGQGVQVPAQL